MGHESKGVFSLGDCAISEARPLPPLAQAAQQVSQCGLGNGDEWVRVFMRVRRRGQGSQPP